METETELILSQPRPARNYILGRGNAFQRSKQAGLPTFQGSRPRQVRTGACEHARTTDGRRETLYLSGFTRLQQAKHSRGFRDLTAFRTLSLTHNCLRCASPFSADEQSGNPARAIRLDSLRFWPERPSYNLTYTVHVRRARLHPYCAL